MKKIITICGAMLFASLIFTSCGGAGKSKSTLVGSWELSWDADEANGIKAGSTILVLNEDKTAREKSSIGETQRTWKTNGSDLCIKASDEDGGIESCGKYELNGDVLTWVIMDMTMEYKRIK